MKKFKQIISEVRDLSAVHADIPDSLLWQLICYSPKMPVRLQQQQLLNEAATFSLPVKDDYFAGKELHFNGFKWGEKGKTVLITHGWGSKAADFAEIIMALKEIPSLQIIAFDAPGNGSSEGDLSNLLLYTEAIKKITVRYGEPDIVIGHSLGAMANMLALSQLNCMPSLLISLAPLIRLKENFEASMSFAGISRAVQDRFLRNFEARFDLPAACFNLTDLYPFNTALNHWLAFDEQDQVAPYAYLKEFLDKYPSISSQSYEGTGHQKILTSPRVIKDLIDRLLLA